MEVDDDDLAAVDAEPFAYLTTTGRRSGRPHRIEIWFGLRGRTLYLLSGGGHGADWVANLRADPAVRIEVGELAADAVARLVADQEEDAVARRLLFEKYARSYSGDLTGWRERALPVAVDLP